MIFEAGKEYWFTYGTTEIQSTDSVKVLEIEGSWLKVEAEKLDTHINVSAPFFISARERNREVEQNSKFSFQSVPRETSSGNLPY